MVEWGGFGFVILFSKRQVCSKASAARKRWPFQEIGRMEKDGSRAGPIITMQAHILISKEQSFQRPGILPLLKSKGYEEGDH